jgi:outer membrane beta-barrel protein
MKKILFTLIILLLTTKIAFSSEGDLYDFHWLDPDKKVYVLQNKVYPKKYKTYVGIGYISNNASKFQDSTGYAAYLGFNFLEEFGIEARHHQYKNKNNTDYQNIMFVNGGEPFVRKMNSLDGGLLVWSPFYGKINTFNKIIYFDLSFGAGYGQIKTQSNHESVVTASRQTEYKNETKSALLTKAALAVHLNKTFSVNLEYFNTTYKGQGPNPNIAEKIEHSGDIILSLSVSF